MASRLPIRCPCENPSISTTRRKNIAAAARSALRKDRRRFCASDMRCSSPPTASAPSPGTACTSGCCLPTIFTRAPQKLGAFLRCDRGAEWTDHHTIGVFKAPVAKIHHVSFEIQDFDAQYLGHEWLTEKGYRHVWGIGRHLLGSQIFDYWYDPHGHIVEHFADGDLFDSRKTPQSFQAGPDSLFQWGPPVPETFFA